MRIAWLITCLLWSCWAPLSHADDKPLPSGMLSYPLAHNLDLQEGTVEFWARLELDVQPHLPSKSFKLLASIMNITGDDGAMSLRYLAGSNFAPEAGYQVRFQPRDRLLPVGRRIVLERGQWHHLAIVWKGMQLQLYLDGQKVSERLQSATMTQIFGTVGGELEHAPTPPRAPRLIFGSEWQRDARVTIDDLRISRIARLPEELGFAIGKLQPDPYTLLLDPLDGTFVPDGVTRTQPTVIQQGEGGLPTAPSRFVEGKFGQALTLCPDAL